MFPKKKKSKEGKKQKSRVSHDGEKSVKQYESTTEKSSPGHRFDKGYIVEKIDEQ